jgi:tRNA A-37 threonylcarbamoyl transferase component Bud32
MDQTDDEEKRRLKQELKKIDKQIEEKRNEIRSKSLEIDKKRLQLLRFKELGFKEVLPKFDQQQNNNRQDTQQQVNRDQSFESDFLFDETLEIHYFDEESFIEFMKLQEKFTNNSNHVQGGNHPIFYGKTQEGNEYVIKKYTISNPQEWRKVKREIKNLNVLNHENVIQIHGIYFRSYHDGQQEANIVLPFYQQGNLLAFAESHQGNAVQSIDWLDIWSQVLLSIQYIHDCGIIHSDIKPQNIFIEKQENQSSQDEQSTHSSEVRPILADFDLSFNTDATTTTTTGPRSTVGGTHSYIAPELFNGNIRR